MKLVVVPAALAELHDAAAFYTASANLDLGLAFVAEFERGANAIFANPKVGSVFRGRRGRYLLRRFPDSIIYQIRPDELRSLPSLISAGVPGYWAGRK